MIESIRRELKLSQKAIECTYALNNGTLIDIKKTFKENGVKHSDLVEIHSTLKGGSN